MGEILLNSGRISYNDSNFIKFKELCKVFNGLSNIIQEFKCSEELGVANFTISCKKVIITQFGRITVRKAKNKEDILKTIDLIVNLMIKHELFKKNFAL